MDGWMDGMCFSKSIDISVSPLFIYPAAHPSSSSQSVSHFFKSFLVKRRTYRWKTRGGPHILKGRVSRRWVFFFWGGGEFHPLHHSHTHLMMMDILPLKPLIHLSFSDSYLALLFGLCKSDGSQHYYSVRERETGRHINQPLPY